MVLLQLTFGRIFQVYVIQGFLCVFFCFLAYKIIKRNKKRLNATLSAFYLSVALAMALNMIYASLQIEFIVKTLNLTTNYCLCIASVFLMMFNLIMYKSQKVITQKIEIAIILIFGCLLLLKFLIPNNITINETTNWIPVWNLTYYIYVIIILTAANIITTYLAFKIYYDIEDKQLKKKWLLFMIGIFGLYIVLYGAFTANILDILIFRTIWNYYSLTIVLWASLIYFGVIRQL
ncbi:MAG TPA: hypothetical protein VGB37_02925 [Candidatus Lokiarchaeia archaeon]